VQRSLDIPDTSPFSLQVQMAATKAQAPEAPPLSPQEAINEVLREVPASFLCPLSKEVMTDPVLLVASGHTYERAALAKHFMEQVRHGCRREWPTIDA
jgi:hypothetical protein